MIRVNVLRVFVRVLNDFCECFATWNKILKMHCKRKKRIYVPERKERRGLPWLPIVTDELETPSVYIENAYACCPYPPLLLEKSWTRSVPIRVSLYLPSAIFRTIDLNLKKFIIFIRILSNIQNPRMKSDVVLVWMQREWIFTCYPHKKKKFVLVRYHWVVI